VLVAVQLIDIVGLVGIIGACGGLYYLSSRIEPHWVAKDRTRFLTVVQDLDQHGIPSGRKRDVRVHLDDESESLLVSRRSIMRPESGTIWTVKSKSTKGKRNIYVLRPQEPRADAGLLALRVPKDSKVVPRLDELLEITGDEATMRRERARYRAAQGLPPDPTAAFGSPGSPPLDPPTDRG
jgi:hypothetical protein